MMEFHSMIFRWIVLLKEMKNLHKVQTQNGDEGNNPAVCAAKVSKMLLCVRAIVLEGMGGRRKVLYLFLSDAQCLSLVLF